MSTPKKSVTIRSADREPIEIPPGRYYINPKARAERMCLNSLSSKARRVYACIELHTMAYRQEYAVTMHNGKMRALRPRDIATETELDPTDVSHALAELECAGLIARRLIEPTPGRNGRKARYRIYSCAVPPKSASEDVQNPGARSRKMHPAWVTSRPDDDPLRIYVNRSKATFSADFVVARSNIEAAELEARALKDAEMRLRAALEYCGAQFPSNKEERKERNLERKGGGGGVCDVLKDPAPSSSSSVSGTMTTTTRAANKKTDPPEDNAAAPHSVWQFARENTVRLTFTRQHVTEYWRQCRQIAAERGPLSADDVLEIMRRTVEAAGGRVEQFRYFVTAAPDQVSAYLDHRAEPAVMASGSRLSSLDRFMKGLDAE